MPATPDPPRPAGSPEAARETGRARPLLLATRNPHKLREIRELLGPEGPDLVSLDEVGLDPDPADETAESEETFEENALSKARHYRARSGLPVLADDSGLCVDALGGAPGVRSRRFAPARPARGEGQDAANNRHLLEVLESIPAPERTARYRCALALVSPGRTVVVTGSVEGRIAEEPRGAGGFGYDPLFIVEGLGATFGELPAATKAARSHRAAAAARLRPWLEPAGTRT